MSRKVIGSLVFIIILGILGFVFLRPPVEPVKNITLLNPLGPTIIPVSALIDNSLKPTEPLAEVKVEFYKNTDEVIARLSGEEATLAVLPLNTATSLYQQGLDIKLLGIHEWKVFYLINNDNSAFTADDLKNNQIYIANNRGNTLDMVMRYSLVKLGLDPDEDLELLYTNPQEIVSLFKSGQIKWAALPEPFVSLALAGGNGKIALDLQENWGEITNTPPRIPVAGLFVKKDFWENHPQECLAMGELLKQSTLWSNENPVAAINKSQAILPMPVNIMQQSLSRIDFHYEDSAQCHEEVNRFMMLLQETFPNEITSIPGAEFYLP